MQQVKIYIETDSSSPKAMQYTARSSMSRQLTDLLK